ncbi:hypothetical protein PVE_R2G0945 [Pseudomonas veronii 1YdBTEX2]|uniref:Uncharacterized protein n=1 Tax=Pseudomonas veronii 1YdBTEX2 TaxID=1295141 RepID=A0A1D3K9I4_PSEVE|nr:hypothetical protein PVE_R2G0945 [Pseudomonas veronii 1YdBTEX2]
MYYHSQKPINWLIKFDVLGIIPPSDTRVEGETWSLCL